jgi:hypothetical protein
MVDAHIHDAAKLTDTIIDVTKRWFGSEDTADARVVALAYAGALGAFLAQIASHKDRTLMVTKTCEALIAGTNVPLRVERWDDLPATEEQRQ